MDAACPTPLDVRKWCLFMGTHQHRKHWKTRPFPANARRTAAWKEVNVHTMRKLFALALMALALAFVAVGCGNKTETPAETATEAPSETVDTTAMAADTTAAAADTTAAH
jgi:hypothetical protein